MRRTLLLMLCTMIVAALLSSCAKEESPVEPTPPTSEKSVVRLMVYNKAEFPYEKIISSRFPNLSLEVIDAKDVFFSSDGGEYKVDLKTFLTQNQADLYYHIDIMQLLEHVALVDLEILAKRDQYDLAGIDSNMIDNVKAQGQGKLVGLSPTFNRDVLFVNKKLFASVGVPLPKVGMTWDEFRRTAKMFTGQEVDGEQVYGYLPAYSSWYSIVSDAGQMNGLRLYDERKKEMLTDLPTWRKLAKDLFDDSTNGTRNMNPGSFTQSNMDRTAMIFGNSRHVAMLMQNNESPQDWGIIPRPVDPNKPELGSAYEADGIFAINASSDRKEEAWEIIKFLHSKEGMQQNADSMTQFKLLTRIEFTPAGQFPIEAFMKQKVWEERFEKGSMRYEGGLLELSAMIDEELDAAIKEQKSFEEAWNRISERGNSILQKYVMING